MSIKHKLLAATTLLILALSIAFTAITCIKEQDALLRGVDEKLFLAARLGCDVVDPGFHDRIVDENSVSPEDYSLIVHKNDALCREYGLQYLWSCMQTGGRLVFTTSTSRSKTGQAGDYAAFFSIHSNPQAYRHVLATMQPEISSFKDEWGEGRMVLIPGSDQKGRKHFFAASVSLNTVNEALKETVIRAATLGFWMLAIGILGSIGLSSRLSRSILRLTQVADSMAKGEMDQEIQFNGSSEIKSLGKSIAQMRDAVRETISKLKSEIQERQRTEKILREAEQRYRVLFGGSPDAILIIDPDSAAIVEFNEIAPHQLGYEPEAFRRLTLYELAPNLPKEEIRTRIREVIKAGRADFETQFKNRAGQIKHFHITALIIPIAQRYVFYCVLRDITERKQAEEELKSSEEKYRSVVDNIGIGVTLINAHREILSMNAQMQAWADRITPGREQVPCRSFSKHDHNGGWEQWPSTKSLRDGRVHEIITELELDNDKRALRIVASPIHDPAGRIIAAIEMVEDFTEKKRLEREILEISEFEKKRLGLDLHDDICQALMGAALQSMVIAQRLQEAENPEAENLKSVSQLLEQITKNVRNLAHDLFPSRLVTDGFSASLRSLAANIEQSFPLSCSFEGSDPVEIRDEKLASHLFRIAQESMHNAAKHSGGSQIKIQVACSQGILRMSIADNGHGNWSGNSGGMGMRTMQYRAHQIDATLKIVAKPGSGTEVLCWAPLKD